MKALLDTHAFLWWIMDDARLSASARKILTGGENEIFLSAASGWEIAIKSALGRLTLPGGASGFVLEQLSENAILQLPVTLSHALHVAALPRIHRDPFDRLLVAQCKIENFSIITADRHIPKYGVKVVW